MRYHDITHDDMKNGDGLRVVLWLSGCDHACPGCQNPVTWDPNDGLLFDDAAKDEIYSALGMDYISGITFSGGDPLFETNREEVATLCQEIRKDFPDKTIWMYTGYSFEDIISQKDCRDTILRYIDVLVDGKYIESLREVTMHWAGSTNQRVIDVNKSLEQNLTVLYGRKDNDKNIKD